MTQRIPLQFFEKNSVIANLLFYHITLHTYFFVFLLNEKGCGVSIFNEKTILKSQAYLLFKEIDIEFIIVENGHFGQTRQHAEILKK